MGMPSCDVPVNFETWAGAVIWWSVQGNVTPLIAGNIVAVILQMRLFALDDCSRKLLVFMVVTFVAEVGTMMWILIEKDLLSIGGTAVLHIWLLGYGESDLCVSTVPHVFMFLWYPCLVFEGILCMFAIWAGIKHSRKKSFWGFNRVRLINILIQGNVVYFFSPLLTCALIVTWSTYKTLPLESFFTGHHSHVQSTDCHSGRLPSHTFDQSGSFH
ncbi:hypothetical protein V8B97DRAFT_1935335 [Scleroderma yunnanense]